MSETIVREAKLFEAAAYPERGIAFTEADLDAIVAGFKAERVQVPVRVQHGRSPWEGKFGRVVDIWRVGKDLMGKIEWPVKVWDFLCAMGTKSLSVGFDWRQRRLKEVSVVDVPRVLTARAFDASMPDELMCFGFDFDAKMEASRMADEYSPEVQAAIKAALERGKTEGAAEARTQFDAQLTPLAKENAELKRSKAKDAAMVILAGWKAEGKLPPACEKFAEAILVDGSAEVTFADGGHMPVASALVQMMTHMPQVVDVKGKVADGGDSPDPRAQRVYAALELSEEQVKAAESVPDLTE